MENKKPDFVLQQPPLEPEKSKKWHTIGVAWKTEKGISVIINMLPLKRNYNHRIGLPKIFILLIVSNL